MNLIKKYLKKLSKYKLSYKDGFFIFPYFGHSPKDMVDGMANMPFVDVNKEQGSIKANTLFMEAHTYFHEVSNGLWVTYGKVNYKKNVSYKRILDEEINSEFHFLSVEITRSSSKRTSTFVNGIPYASYSILLFKPDISNIHSHLSNSLQESITFWFDDQFLREEILSKKDSELKSLSAFYKQDIGMLMTPVRADLAEQASSLVQQLFKDKLENNKNPNAAFRQFITLLLKECNQLYPAAFKGSAQYGIEPQINQKVLKAQQILMDYVTEDKFNGIEWLAAQVGLSATSLKTNYKIVFGTSIFQQLKLQKMLLAKQLLAREQLPVSRVAQIVGYQNPSKFTAAFKAQFGVTPSEFSTTYQ